MAFSLYLSHDVVTLLYSDVSADGIFSIVNSFMFPPFFSIFSIFSIFLIVFSISSTSSLFPLATDVAKPVMDSICTLRSPVLMIVYD